MSRFSETEAVPRGVGQPLVHCLENIPFKEFYGNPIDTHHDSLKIFSLILTLFPPRTPSANDQDWDHNRACPPSVRPDFAPVGLTPHGPPAQPSNTSRRKISMTINCRDRLSLFIAFSFSLMAFPMLLHFRLDAQLSDGTQTLVRRSAADHGLLERPQSGIDKVSQARVHTAPLLKRVCGLLSSLPSTHGAPLPSRDGPPAYRRLNCVNGVTGFLNWRHLVKTK